MDSEEAFALLGLPTDADEESITQKYRELAAKLHPDRGGDSSLMQELNRARDVARAHLSAIRSLTVSPQGNGRLAVTTPEVLRMVALSQAPERLVAAASRHSQDRIEAMRRQVFLAGGVGVAALFMAKDFFPELLSRLNPSFLDKDTFLGTLLVVGMIGVVATWQMAERIRRIERDAVEFSRLLIQRKFFAQVFEAIFLPTIEHTYAELVLALTEWEHGPSGKSAATPESSGEASPRAKALSRELELTRNLSWLTGADHVVDVLVLRGLENGSLRRALASGSEFIDERFVYIRASREA